MVDHKDGHPDHTERKNLQYLCRQCNTAKGFWFKSIGKGRLTHQYNPAGGPPTYEQYAWAVSQQEHSGEHGEAGAIIHATPKDLRREYAERIGRKASRTKRERADDRWNPANPWPFGKRLTARDTTPATGGAAYHSAKRKPAVSKSKKKSESGGFFSVPDEETLQRGFAKGLSLSDMLKSNPYLAAMRKSNPAKFDRCVKAVQTKGGAANAYAVCSAAGTRNPSWVTQQRKFEGWALKANLRFDSKTGYVDVMVPIEGEKKEDWVAYHDGEWMTIRFADHRPAVGGGFNQGTGERYGDADYSVHPGGGTMAGAVKAVKRRFGKLWSVRANPGRKNPAAASAEVFEEFHGYPSEELVTVKQKVHRHKHLAAAGDLVGLEVRPIGGGKVRRIEGLGDALLTFNEAKNQLFVSGGDQFLPPAELKKFGVTEDHELQTIGKLKGVGYFTDKTHLGDEGGEAVYSHTFRTTNKAGRHVVVKIAREPDLLYHVLNQELLISGGSYDIKAEGIDK